MKTFSLSGGSATVRVLAAFPDDVITERDAALLHTYSRTVLNELEHKESNRNQLCDALKFCRLLPIFTHGANKKQIHIPAVPQEQLCKQRPNFMKKIIACALVAAAASLTLVGCVTGNASITDEQKVSSIQIGKSTMQDVERTLGKPGDVELQQGGEQVWTYQTVKTTAMAFIPIANMMGKSEEEHNLTVRFNKKGVVTALGRGQHNM